MTKTYELPNDKMIMADVDEKHHTATVSVFALDDLVEAVNKTGYCEDCKHFRKLPFHADTLGKCIHHTGFCPKGDWYCADFEPQESDNCN